MNEKGYIANEENSNIIERAIQKHSKTLATKKEQIEQERIK